MGGVGNNYWAFVTLRYDCAVGMGRGHKQKCGRFMSLPVLKGILEPSNIWLHHILLDLNIFICDHILPLFLLDTVIEMPPHEEIRTVIWRVNVNATQMEKQQ